MEKINDNYYFRTKGDNNNTEDAWTIDQVSVIGKAVTMIPYAGKSQADVKHLVGTRAEYYKNAFWAG